MTKTARTRFLDSVVEVYDALLAAIDATEARGHKVSRTLIAEARRGERDVEALARKWEAGKLADNIGAAIDVQMNAERRALELARESLAGADEYRQEVRQSLSRVIAANREAASALATVARQEAPRVQAAGERVRAASQRLRKAATARLGGRAPAPAKKAVTKRAPRRARRAKATTPA